MIGPGKYRLTNGKYFLKVGVDFAIVYGSENLVDNAEPEHYAGKLVSGPPSVKDVDTRDGRVVVAHLTSPADVEERWTCDIRSYSGDRTWNSWAEYTSAVYLSEEYKHLSAKGTPILLYARPTSKGGGCWLEVNIAPSRLLTEDGRVDTSKLTWREEALV